MSFRNDLGDELTYHGGPLDGQPLNVFAYPGPHDDGYEVRTDDNGRILGAWWLPNAGSGSGDADAASGQRGGTRPTSAPPTGARIDGDVSGE